MLGTTAVYGSAQGEPGWSRFDLHGNDEVTKENVKRFIREYFDTITHYRVEVDVKPSGFVKAHYRLTELQKRGYFKQHTRSPLRTKVRDLKGPLKVTYRELEHNDKNADTILSSCLGTEQKRVAVAKLMNDLYLPILKQMTTPANEDMDEKEDVANPVACQRDQSHINETVKMLWPGLLSYHAAWSNANLQGSTFNEYKKSLSSTQIHLMVKRMMTSQRQ